MRVLILGWEFPPHSVGGLGRHTYELVKALSKAGVDVTLILPFADYKNVPGVRFRVANVGGITSVYKNFGPGGSSLLYGHLSREIELYTKNAAEIGAKERFDVIHGNDWLTARAAVKLKMSSGKPLLFTMHSTEYDRTIWHPWEAIVKEEELAVRNADVIVAVSQRLKDELVKRYSVPPDKVSVIHNAVDRLEFSDHKTTKSSKVVLYVGRLSPQKWIDHLIKAFKIVSEQDKDALLYIVGDGPEMKNLIELSIDFGLSDRVIFFGTVSERDLGDFYGIAKVFVMPSVTEPFGITALEAIASGTPAIISLQSGASEVLKNVFKVDFWDSKQMADLILGLLRYSGVGETISGEAYNELADITWENVAKKFIELYSRVGKAD